MSPGPLVFGSAAVSDSLICWKHLVEIAPCLKSYLTGELMEGNAWCWETLFYVYLLFTWRGRQWETTLANISQDMTWWNVMSKPAA